MVQLSGKKSYLAGGGLVVVGIAVLAGFVSLDEQQLQGVMALLGGAATIALRLAMSKAATVAAEAATPEAAPAPTAPAPPT